MECIKNNFGRQRPCKCEQCKNTELMELKVTELLDAMLKLEQNWDSYGAAPINKKAIEIAKQLAPHLSGFRVVPTASGGIQFGRSMDDVEIEISA